MIVRGGAVGLIGVLLFRFTDISHTSTYGIGALMLVSGICSIWAGTANRRTEEFASWLIIGGLIDAAFGVAALVVADGTLQSVRDLIGFWAVVFSFLQAAQAIYSYIGPSGVRFESGTKLAHILLVATSLWLAFDLLMKPGATTNSVGLTGLLPIVMGGLLIMLIVKLRSKTGVDVSNKPVVKAS